MDLLGVWVKRIQVKEVELSSGTRSSQVVHCVTGEWMWGLLLICNGEGDRNGLDSDDVRRQREKGGGAGREMGTVTGDIYKVPMCAEKTLWSVGINWQESDEKGSKDARYWSLGKPERCLVPTQQHAPRGDP